MRRRAAGRSGLRTGRQSATTSRACTSAGRDSRRRSAPSAMAVLPTPGSPSRIGLFLERRARIWMTRATSLSRPVTCSARDGPCCAVCGCRRAAAWQSRCAAHPCGRRAHAPHETARYAQSPRRKHVPTWAAIPCVYSLMAAGAPARATGSGSHAGHAWRTRAAAHRVNAAIARVLAQVAAELGQRALALHRRPAAALALRRSARPGGSHQKKRAQRVYAGNSAGRATVNRHVRLG